jgi:dienelactone hydrolase
MASHPPKLCCTVGVKHQGEATGEFKNIGDSIATTRSSQRLIRAVDTYFAYPPDRSTDNAANGYFTVMPDLFRGDPIPLNRSGGFDINAWRAKHTTDHVDPIVEATIKEVKKYGAKRIGTVGYCFGAKFVVRFLKTGVTDAGYVAHPSWVAEEELKAIQGPFSIAAAGKYRMDRR